MNVSIDTSSKSASEPESASVISQDALHSRLPPGTLHLGHRCVGFEDFGAHVAVDFENQTSVKARLMIGADGVRSVVRRNLLSDGALTYTGELLLCDRALSISFSFQWLRDRITATRVQLAWFMQAGLRQR